MYKNFIIALVSAFIFSAGTFAQNVNNPSFEKAQCLISASASFELIALNALPAYKQASAPEEDELALLLIDAANLHGKIALLASSAFKNELSDVIGNQLVRDVQKSVQLFKEGNSHISEKEKKLLIKNNVDFDDNVKRAEEQLDRYLTLLR